MIKLPPPQKNKVAVAPSVLSADLLNLGAQINEVTKAGADWLHIDIMDGHFVPNLSFGPALVSHINKKTALPQDVHLMVQYPQRFIEPFIKAGASSLILHEEAQGDLPSLLKQIKAMGLSAGLSIKPDTKPEVLKPFLPFIDEVLIMSVYPGFGGQGFLETSAEQIEQARKLIDQSGRNIWLEVDGGINKDTARRAVKAGATALVAGAAVFGAANPAEALREIKTAANNF